MRPAAGGVVRIRAVVERQSMLVAVQKHDVPQVVRFEKVTYLPAFRREPHPVAPAVTGLADPRTVEANEHHAETAESEESVEEPGLLWSAELRLAGAIGRSGGRGGGHRIEDDEAAVRDDEGRAGRAVLQAERGMRNRLAVPRLDARP